MPAHNTRGIVTIRDVTRTAVDMEQLSKHAQKEEEQCFLRGPRRWGYKKEIEDRLSQMNIETPPCQNMSLEAKEQN
jgi:hypothetical protein